MGQGQEDDVVTAQDRGARGLDLPVRQRDQMRLVLAEWRSRAGAGGDGTNLHARMARQQPEQLSAGVSRRSGHGSSNVHRNDYVTIGISMPLDALGPTPMLRC